LVDLILLLIASRLLGLIYSEPEQFPGELDISPTLYLNIGFIGLPFIYQWVWFFNSCYVTKHVPAYSLAVLVFPFCIFQSQNGWPNQGERVHISIKYFTFLLYFSPENILMGERKAASLVNNSSFHPSFCLMFMNRTNSFSREIFRYNKGKVF